MAGEGMAGEGMAGEGMAGDCVDRDSAWAAPSASPVSIRGSMTGRIFIGIGWRST